MKLYFLRHADAVPGFVDAERALSPRGRQQARLLGRFLETAGVVFDAAYASPLVRARQTADEILSITGRVEPHDTRVTDALLNETPDRDFEAWLRSLPEAYHVLLVGHNPSMSQRVQAILGIEGPAALDMPKGGLACVRTADGRSGELKFYVTPRILGADR